MGHTHIDGSYSREPQDLWGVYIRGADEWKAVTSQGAAMAHANKLNAMFAGTTPRAHDPHMWAIPDLWPFSAEDHAAERQF